MVRPLPTPHSIPSASRMAGVGVGVCKYEDGVEGGREEGEEVLPGCHVCCVLCMLCVMLNVRLLINILSAWV